MLRETQTLLEVCHWPGQTTSPLSYRSICEVKKTIKALSNKVEKKPFAFREFMEQQNRRYSGFGSPDKPKVAFGNIDTATMERGRSSSGSGKALDRRTALSEELMALASDTPNAIATPSNTASAEAGAKVICCLPFSSQHSPLFSEDIVISQFTSESVPTSPPALDPVKSLCTLNDLCPILNTIYGAHIRSGQPLYLRPESEQGEARQAITKLKAICGCIISWHLLVVKSCLVEMPKPTLNHMIGEAPMWAAKRILCHFAQLMKNRRLYKTAEDRFALLNYLSLILSPKECVTHRDYPFIARMTAENTVGAFKRGSKVYVVVDVDNTAKIYNEKGNKVKDAEFRSGYALVDGKTILYVKEKKAQITLSGGPNKADWDHVLGKTNGAMVDDVRLMGVTFAALAQYPFPPALGDALAKLFLTFHQKPSRAFVSLVTEDQAPEPGRSLQHLANLFKFYGQEMRFLKMLVEYNIAKSRTNTNELFRENNQATLYLVNFLKQEMKAGVVDLAELFSQIVSLPAFDYDHPKDEDVETVDRLFDLFWDGMNHVADKMTCNARCLLSFIRSLSEMTFVDEKLNHRGVVGLFFLRVIVPAFTSPVNIGIDVSKIARDDLRKSLAFAKLIMSASTLDLSYSALGDRKKLNPIFEKNAPRVVLFLERITTSANPTFGVDGKVTAAQFAESLAYLTKYVKDWYRTFEQLAGNVTEAPLYTREVVYQMYRDPEYYCA